MGETQYQALLKHVKDVAVVQSISGVLSWDQETMMPAEGSAHRARQMALLAGLAHERITSTAVADGLAALEGTAWLENASAEVQANVRETRRVHDRLRRVPRRLVEELARAVPPAQQAWAAARRDDAFAAFLPHLENIVALKREEAAALAGGGELYDALLDEFEPGARIATIAPFLDALAEGLLPLVRAIADKGNPPLPWQGRSFPVEQQRALCASVPPWLGLRHAGSRLDASAHPFSQRIGHGDVRITTRYDERDPRGAYFGVLHETGHALYEQGLDPAHDGTPAGEARSTGVHESQSRLWENMVGRSHAYWCYAYPLVRAMFPAALHDVELDAFHRAVNRVEMSQVRVEADEVTYNLHIVLRVRLERALIGGSLAPKDVAGAWREEAQRVLGVAPATDALGCLQDVHWSVGAFGYFPTYALGNVYAAQLMEGARAALPALDDDVSRGRLAPLLHWLITHVHRRGSTQAGARLIEEASGRPADSAAFLRYVQAKYRPLYGL